MYFIPSAFAEIGQSVIFAFEPACILIGRESPQIRGNLYVIKPSSDSNVIFSTERVNAGLFKEKAVCPAHLTTLLSKPIGTRPVQDRNENVLERTNTTAITPTPKPAIIKKVFRKPFTISVYERENHFARVL